MTPVVPPSRFIFSAISRTLNALGSLAFAILFILVLHTTDLAIFFLNLVTPRKARGTVIPPAFSPADPPNALRMPIAWIMCTVANVLGPDLTPDWLVRWSTWSGVGHGGRWSQAVQAPKPGDSRCPCPALNALANHGIIPHNGRHLTPHQVAAATYRCYGLAPTLAIQLIAPFATFYEDRGWFDLEDIGAQACEDLNSPEAGATVVGTQGTPSRRLIDLYFPPTGTTPYTCAQYSAVLAHRRNFSREHNPQFTLSPTQYVFSSGNFALVHEIFGRDYREFRSWIGAGGYEQLVDEFEPSSRQAWGISILQAQLWTAIVELGCGPLKGKRMVGIPNDIAAQDGWDASSGKVGVTTK